MQDIGTIAALNRPRSQPQVVRELELELMAGSAGDLPAALDALRRAVELDEREGRSYQLIGRVLDRMGRPEEAMPMYRRAREIANT
jgi:Flp pilus assembly protein TadD